MKENSKFLKAISIYSLALLVIIGAALVVLWMYIGAYERSRPINYANAFAAEKDAEFWKEGVLAAIKSGSGEFDKRDGSLEEYGINISSESEISCKASTVGETEADCSVFSGDIQIAQLKLKKGGSLGFGMHGWEVSDCVFTPGADRTLRITIPPDSKLTINGMDVGESYITDREIAYDINPEKPFDISPLGVRYTITDLHGPIELAAIDSEGKALASVENSSGSISFTPEANKSFKFSASEDAKVFINGQDISGQYSTDADPGLRSDFGGYIDSNVMMYSCDNLISVPEIKVTTAGGDPLTVGTQYLGADCYVAGAAPVPPDAIKDYVVGFAKAYITFSGNIGNSPDANFGVLNWYLLPGTPLQHKLSMTPENIAWVINATVDYKLVEAIEYVPYGDFAYACKIHYQITNTRGASVKELDETLEIFVVKDNKGAWKVAKMEIA